jgi:hypothetical protein
MGTDSNIACIRVIRGENQIVTLPGCDFRREKSRGAGLRRSIVALEPVDEPPQAVLEGHFRLVPDRGMDAR